MAANCCRCSGAGVSGSQIPTRSLRRITVRMMLVGAAVLAALGGSKVLAAEPQGRPSVLVILADDLGYADISLHGCREVATPHIDSIGRNGVRCTSGYVSGPYCSPTRA